MDLQHEGGPQLPRPGKVRGARGAAQLPKSSLAMAVIVGVMVGADDVVMAAWFRGSTKAEISPLLRTPAQL